MELSLPGGDLASGRARRVRSLQPAYVAFRGPPWPLFLASSAATPVQVPLRGLVSL